MKKTINKQEIIALILLVPATIITLILTITASSARELFVCLFCFMGLALATGAVTFFVIQSAIAKKGNKKQEEQLLSTLTSEFREVTPIHHYLPQIISAGNVKCVAKIDADNKIRYKITIDEEVVTSNYNLFSSYFIIPEKEDTATTKKENN